MVSALSSVALMDSRCVQRVVAGQGGHEGLVVKRRHRQAGVWKRLGHDGAIDLTGAQHLQQFHREVLLQHERHLRRCVDAVAHQLGQQIRRDGVDDAQAQWA